MIRLSKILKIIGLKKFNEYIKNQDNLKKLNIINNEYIKVLSNKESVESFKIKEK